MGKTERGTVWLDANKTSPFEFFQFWRNIPDDKVNECLNFFTDFKAFEAIEVFPGINNAKKILAVEITKLVHGEEAAAQALKQAEALFRDQDASVMEATPIADSVHILDLMMRCGFARSRTDARNLINGRGVSINNEVLTDPTIIVTKEKFGNELVVRKGKKHFCRLLIEDKCQDPNS
jgi:tyrosyl-tRNA synthetase